MATLTGTPGDNVIHGTTTADTISGLAGNDRLYGSSGDDTVGGDDGDDLVNGGAGRDAVGGGEGNDTLYGGSGNDVLLSSSFLSFLSSDEGDDVAYGGAGNDFFQGVEFSEQGGDDWMDGGPGNDVFDYTIPWTFFREGLVPIGNDTIIGGSGTDRVQFSDPGPYAPSPSYNMFHGSTTAAVVVDLKNGTFSTAEVSGTIVGVEEIMGSEYADTILGSRRAESLSGSHGNDHIEGRGGNDRLDGGFGLNTLNGGAGADDFVFNAINSFFLPFGFIEAGFNVIEDFTSRDELLFDNSSFDALGAEGAWSARDARFYAAAGATSGHDANDRLIYNTTTGDLYYDADGSGAGAALPVASLQGAPTLTACDITVI
jgi:Ca2+-binding RTX toxin-like protein